MVDSSDESARPALSTETAAGTESLQVGTRGRKRGSVRVNLSVPADVDAVLAGLAAKTGASKASFVMQALRWYLPDLQIKLAEFDEVQAHIRRKQRQAVAGNPPELSYESRLPRAERRRLERERLKPERKERKQDGP